MTLATVVHQPAPGGPQVAASRPTRHRPSPAGAPTAGAPTVVVTLRLTLGDTEDPVAALAELVDRLGARHETAAAPAWLAEVQRAEIHQPHPDQPPADEPSADQSNADQSSGDQFGADQSTTGQAVRELVPEQQTATGTAAEIAVRRRSRSVAVAGRDVELCRREFDLLLYLADNPGQVFTRGQLLEAVWGSPFTGERTVDVHVTRLRKKLAGGRQLITTVRGVGYRLSDSAHLSIVDTATGPGVQAA